MRPNIGSNLCRHTGKQRTVCGRTFPNVPLLRRHGSMIQFLTLEELLDDITTGFPMCGRLTPGACWDSKDDRVPKNPLSRSEFFQKNEEHIDKCLLTRRPDSYALEMLPTVLKEVREEKMSGPCEALNHWATTIVPPSEHDQSSLLQLPSGPVAAAVAFSIVTEVPGRSSGSTQNPPRRRLAPFTPQ